MTIRLAVVADIHHGPDACTKRGSAALGLLREFVAFANAEVVDAVIDLGDRISDVDPEADRRRAAEVAEVFAGLEAPRHHVDGNHDRDHLSAAENAAILGTTPRSVVVPLGAWDLALWRADPFIHRGPRQRGFALPEDDFLWLEAVAREATRPLLVVSHVPVSPVRQEGNYYFERHPESAAYPEAPRVRAALARARVPVACLSGHVHWNTLAQADGIAYLTQQALTETFTTQGEPAAAWGLVTLGETLHWHVMGKDPIETTLTLRAARWVPSLLSLGAWQEAAE